MQIVYENDFLLVAKKPHGWLTVPGRFADDPRPVFGLKLQEQLNRQIYPVHRLDFEVEGLTLWAKDPDSHRIAQKWFETSDLRRVYHALSLPAPTVAEGEWCSKLAKGKRRAFEAAHGKPSRTLARILDKGSTYRWELTALTGRPHQLRFEMFKHGASILGDELYGGRKIKTENALALSAVELDFSKISERLGLPEVIQVEAHFPEL